MHRSFRTFVAGLAVSGLLAGLLVVAWFRNGPAPSGAGANPGANPGANAAGPGGVGQAVRTLVSAAERAERAERGGTRRVEADPAGVPAATGSGGVGASTAGAPERAAFDVWRKRAVRGPGGWDPAVVAEGVVLARERREALRALIVSDPRSALSWAVRGEERRRLPEVVVAELEELVAARGRLEVLCAQAMPGRPGAGGGWYRTLDVGDRVYRVFVYGRRLAQGSAGGVSVQGIAVDDLLAVEEDPVRVLGADEVAEAVASGRLEAGAVCALTGAPVDGRGAGGALPVVVEHGDRLLALSGPGLVGELNRRLASVEPGFRSPIEPPAFPQWSHGAKRLLFMRARFPDDLREPISEADAAEVMRAANEYFTQASFNNLSVFSTIGPLVMLPQPKLYYSVKGPSALLQDARAATRAAGVEPEAFDLDMVRFESVPGFDWGGLGLVGGKGVWLQSSALGVVCHELGHNLGLAHANFWNTVRPALPQNPQNLPFDADSLVGLDSIYGPGDDEEYGDPFDLMGGGGGGEAHFTALHKHRLGWLPEGALLTVNTSGVYRVMAHDLGVTGGDVPQVLRVRKDAERFYWLSARALAGDNPWLANGIELHFNPWHATIASCLLLDTTPGSRPGRNDAALTLGRTFIDDAAQVFVTVVGRGTVGVGGRSVPYYDVAVERGPFPGNTAPTLDLAVSAEEVAVGQPVIFQAGAVDTDGDLVAYAWDFGDGRTGLNEPSATVSWSRPGDYVVRCEVSDRRGGLASRNVGIRVGGVRTLRIGGQVIDQAGRPLGRVRVHNGMAGTNSPYAPEYRWGYTDSEGRYLLTGMDPGSYEVGAVLDGSLIRPLNFARPLVLDRFTGVGVDFVSVALPRATVGLVQNGAESGAAPVVFRVGRQGSTQEVLRVYFRTAGGATTNEDYRAWSPVEVQTNVIPTVLSPVRQALEYGYVDLPPGVQATNVSLAVLPDTQAEGDETVSLTLVAPVMRTVVTETETNVFDIPGWEVRGENGRDAWYQTRPAYHPGSLEEAVGRIVDGTPPGPTTLSIAALERAVSENAGDSATFLVSRTGRAPAGALRIPLLLGGTAAAGDDFERPDDILEFPAGVEAVRLTIPVFDDRFVEGNESLRVELGTGSGYVLGGRSATVTVVDNDLPWVAVIATDPVVGEGAGSGGAAGARVTFQRSGDLGQALEVDYLLAGSAVPGVDYAPLSGRVTLPAGASSAGILIVPFDDADLEGDETVEVRLGDSPEYNPVASSRAVVVLRDDEQPVVTVEAVDDTATEGSDDPGVFLFRRAGDASGPLSVRYRFAGSAVHQGDFVASGDRLILGAGQRQAVLTVSPIDDALREDPETIALELVEDPAYVIGTPSRAAVTLEDNGDATLAAGFALLASQASESRTNPELAVRVSGNPEPGDLNAVTVVYEVLGGSASAGTDYVLTQGSLVFPNAPADSETPLTNRVAFIPLLVIDDLLRETDETVLVRLRIGPTILPSEDTNQPPQVQTNGVTDVYAVHTFTILDDDRSVVTVAASEASTVEGSAVPARFTVKREGGTNLAQVVTFHLSGLAAPGSDYVAVSNQVRFEPGQASVDVAIVPVDDPLMEFREDVVLTLMSAPGSRIGPDAVAVVTVDDNDGTIEFASARWPVDEGAGEARIQVRRSGDTRQPASVLFAALPGTADPLGLGTNGLPSGDFQPTNGMLTFAPGEVEREFAILLRDDDVVEGPETVELRLSRGSGLFPLGGQNTAVLTLLDNDALISAGTNGAFGIETDGVAIVRLERSGPTDADLRVSYATLNQTAVAGEDYEAASGSVTFLAGDRQAEVRVPLLNDFLIEGEEQFLLRLTAEDGTVVVDLPVAIVDDDCAVEFASATAEVDEDGGVVELVVRRVGSPLKPVAVDYVTAPASATAGADYEPAEGTLRFLGNRFESSTNGTGEVVFLEGETNQVLSVRILNDADGERDETFVVGLLRPRSGSPLLTIPFVTAGSVTQAVVTVRDNEAPGRLDDQFQPGLGADATVRALALQADGKALVGGDFQTFDGVVLPRLARLHADGLVDRSFNPGRGFDGQVLAVTEAAEGRILVGGDFTSVEGRPLSHLARLEPDGTRVAGFDLGLDGPVRALLSEPLPVGANASPSEVRAWAGGDFSVVSGLPRGGVVRLQADGRVDPGFVPGAAAPGTRSVRALAWARGSGDRLLVGGVFSDWGGTGARNLVRLLPDGGVDPAFGAAALGLDGAVTALVVGADGRIYLGGGFTRAGGLARSGVARLGADGGVDPVFDPGTGANAAVLAAGLQGSGRVVFGGAFDGFGGEAAGRFVRLTPEGAYDPTFFRGVGANDTVRAIVVQPDGAFLLAGDFTEINERPRLRVARIHADEKFSEGFVEFAGAVFEAGEAEGTARITVRRTGAAKGAARVGYRTSDLTARAGEDYESARGELEFAAGETNRTFVVRVIDDALAEGTETVALSLVDPVGATLGRFATATLALEDDEAAVAFEWPEVEVSEDAGGVDLAVRRSGSLAAPASVTWRTEDGDAVAGDDYDAAAGTSVFDAGVAVVTVRVPIRNDTAIEGTEFFKVRIDAASEGLALGSQREVRVALADDDRPPTHHSLVLEASPGGTVTPGSGRYPVDSVVRIEALPAGGWEFARWEGTVVSSDNPLFLRMDRTQVLTARFRPRDYLETFESGGFGRLPWHMDGVAWVVTNETASGGSFSARSGAVGDGGDSGLWLERETPAGGGSFDFRTATETGWDFLEFHLNGVRLERWSGTLGWQTFRFNVPAGRNRLEWRFRRDRTFGDAADAVWIDNLDLPEEGAEAVPARITWVGDAGSCRVRVEGTPGRLQVLEASGDLRAWTAVAQAVSGLEPLVLTDPGCGGVPVRFYRVRTE